MNHHRSQGSIPIDSVPVVLIPGQPLYTGQQATPEVLAAALPDMYAAQQTLMAMGVRKRAQCIAAVARRWLAACEQLSAETAAGLAGDAKADTEFGIRRDWFAAGCAQAGLSVAMLRWGMRETLGQWTETALIDLVERELGGCAVVDRDGHAGSNSATVAMAPRLCLHVLARTVPPAGLQSVAMAWLLGAATVVRPSAHLAGLVLAFMGALAPVAPELAAVTCVVCADAADHTWRAALADHADAIVVHGSDNAVDAWRAVAAPEVRFVAHGHRISAAYLAADALDESTLGTHLHGLAHDLCAWDQLGCLSPVTLYVERGGAATPDEVAKQLVEVALPPVERALPPGPWSRAERAERTLFVRARLLEARAYASASAHILVFDQSGPLEASCLHRVLLVRPVASLDALATELEKAAPHLQALAIGGARAARLGLAQRLARAGLNRICAPGALQRPPLWWSHDGQGALRPLVRWLDLR